MARRFPNHDAGCRLNSSTPTVVLMGCDCTGNFSYPPITAAAPPGPSRAPLAEVKPFTGANINDLPARLRAIADAIERGEDKFDTIAYVGFEPSGKPRIGVLGPCLNKHEAIGMFQHAIHELLRSLV